MKGVQVLFDQLKKKKKKLYSFFSFAEAILEDCLFFYGSFLVKYHQNKCVRFKLCLAICRIFRLLGYFLRLLSLSLTLSQIYKYTLPEYILYEFSERFCDWTYLSVLKCNEYWPKAYQQAFNCWNESES